MAQMTPDRMLISGAVPANRQPHLVPSLAELLADPGRAGDLPPEQVPALLAEVAAALVALAARMSAAPPTNRKWVYRHQEKLEAQRLSPKCLRIPLRAVERMLGTNED
jgi:hypothetical protein